MYSVTNLIPIEIYKRSVVVVHFSLPLSYHGRDSSVVNYSNDYVFVRCDHVAVVFISLYWYYFRNAVVISLYYSNQVCFFYTDPIVFIV